MLTGILNQRDLSSAKLKYRDITLDQIKGIGIICMVIGHFTDLCHNFIFSFHMPLFFIAAGYVFKPKGVKNILQNDLRRLIIPYCFVASILLIWWLIIDFYHHDFRFKTRLLTCLWANGSINHTSRYFSEVPMIGAIWFLWGMFWCKQMFNLIVSKTTNLFLINTICLSIAAICIYIDCHWVNLPLAFLPGLSGLIFFCVGYTTKICGEIKAIPYTLIGSLGIIWYLSFTISEMSMVRCYYMHPIINYVGAVGAFYILYTILHFLNQKVLIGGGGG